MTKYALFSVANGKFHKPAEPFDPCKAWRPTLTVCGRTITPLNYFETNQDADNYTGGRLALKLCQHCEAA